MNEQILSVIKKKAEGKYHFDVSDYLSDDEADVKIKEQEAYTSGQVDAIEMMMKFVGWIDDSYANVHSEELNKSAWINCKEENVLANGSDYHYTTLINEAGHTTEQLLLKYMEDNKL